MVTIQAWTRDAAKHWAGRDDSVMIFAPTNGQAFDEADRLGAVRIVDGLGKVFRKIEGEWYQL